MPTPALPVRLGERPKQNMYRHRYVDPLDHPMTGSVAITALKRLGGAGATLPEQATAVVELVDGLLEVHLRPGFYKLVATLTSPSGHKVTDTVQITITG